MKATMFAASLTLLCANNVALAVNTFTAVSGDDWNTSQNWSAGTVPVAGDDVVVAGNITLTNSTPVLNSYTLNVGFTHIFNGWDTVLRATDVHIYGKMTHAQNADTTAEDGWTPNARVNVECTNLSVYSAGSIDVMGLGYLGGNNAVGYGPGGGNKPTTGGGGGYGGVGGGSAGTYGKVYGDPVEPADPGSGGGGGNGAIGGNGGGAVRIAALGNVSVLGAINADGGSTASNYRGGGSGGSVHISCLTISGGGTISAKGGNVRSWSASGGGGRISIEYDTAAQAAEPLPGIVMSATSGTRDTTSPQGDVGTLYLPDSQFLTRQSGAILHSGQWLAPGFTEWERDSLALENAWIRIPAAGFVLNVTNAFSVAGSIVGLHRLELTNATVSCGALSVSKASLSMMRGVTTGTSLSVDGDMALQNAAQFSVYGGESADVDLPGSTVDVAGTLLISGKDSWIFPYSHPTNGGSVRFTAQNVTIATAGAGFDASARGYSGGPVGGDGFGPGAGGFIVSLGRGSGGGYGGAGGRAFNGFSQPYGSYTAPVEPGSGGGGQDKTGGAGGGAVWIVASGTVEVNGSILADGSPSSGSYAGAGSGGGIYVECDKIIGANGIVNARGGAGLNFGCSGGGGRIAVMYNTEAQGALPVPSIAYNAAMQTYSVNATPGDIGTLYFPDSLFLTNATTLHLSGVWMAPGVETHWSPVSGTVIASSWLRFPTGDMTINAGGDLTVVGTDKLIHKLDLRGGTLSIAGNMKVDGSVLNLFPTTSGSRSELHCSGGFAMTNAAVLNIYASPTNSSVTEYGALLNVAGSMDLRPGSMVYPYSQGTNGAGVLFRTGDLTVGAGAAFDATTKGYTGGFAGSGFGPGKGLLSGGGGHGGRGGRATDTNSGMTNGVEVAPIGAGSGGGSNSGILASNGGGLIWIESTGKVHLDGGKLLANSGKGGNVTGGGSGGGIMVRCERFSGTSTAVVSAFGGDSGGWGYGGGGGRIAVWYNVPDEEVDRIVAGGRRRVGITQTHPGYEGSISVAPGLNSSNYAGSPYSPGPGTVVFLTLLPPAETLITIK